MHSEVVSDNKTNATHRLQPYKILEKCLGWVICKMEIVEMLQEPLVIIRNVTFMFVIIMCEVQMFNVLSCTIEFTYSEQH